MAPMSNAERQRKYREKIKQNAEKYEEKKKKNREYMKAARRPIAELTEKEKEKKSDENGDLPKKKQKEGGVTKLKNNKCCALNARLCEKLKKRITDQKKVIDNILLKKRALQKNLYRHKIKIEELRKLISNSKRTENKSLINSSENKTNSESVPTDINAPTTSTGLTTTDKSENEDLREKTPMSKTLSFINENIPSISTSEKNINVELMSINENETDFVFLDDDDYIYFD